MRYVNLKLIGKFTLLTVDERPWLTTLYRWLSPWLPFLAVDESQFYRCVYKDGLFWFEYPRGSIINRRTGEEFDSLILNQKLDN
jgi:hypothetical protein